MSSKTLSRIVRRPRAPVLRFIARCATARKRVLAKLELDPFHVEEFAVLLGQGVLRLFENTDECVLIQFFKRCHHRQPADELRDQAELDQVLRLNVMQQLTNILFFRIGLDVGDESNTALGRAIHELFSRGRQTHRPR